MNVGQLIKELQTLDPSLPVMRPHDEFSGAKEINEVKSARYITDFYGRNDWQGPHEVVTDYQLSVDPELMARTKPCIIVNI